MQLRVDLGMYVISHTVENNRLSRTRSSLIEDGCRMTGLREKQEA